jgi:hypothetical protein
MSHHEKGKMGGDMKKDAGKKAAPKGGSKPAPKK